MRQPHHQNSINHIRRIIGQLNALAKTIESESSCTQISTEMFSILQSMKGLSERMFVNSLENSIFRRKLDDKDKAKLDKTIKLITS